MGSRKSSGGAGATPAQRIPMQPENNEGAAAPLPEAQTTQAAPPNPESAPLPENPAPSQQNKPEGTLQQRFEHDDQEFKPLPGDPFARGHERKPFGQHEFKLELSVPAGYKGRWINDHPGRIERAKGGGWFHMLDDKGQPIKRVVEVRADGGGLHAYAMLIRKEWYEEDMAAQAAENDRIDRSLRRGKDGEEEIDEGDNQYVPDRGKGISFGNPTGTRRQVTKVAGK